MKIAELIVDQLLEQANVCVTCQHESGQGPQPGSHGYCKRHMIEMYRGNMEMMQKRGVDVSSLNGKLQAIMQRPDSDFPPDMSQQRQAAPARM